MSMIEFKNVSKTYNNGTKAIQNVSLHVDKGEFVFIVGSSGAGKSTFLKLLMCEEVPSSGEITINGRAVNELRRRDIPYLRRTMGIVFQDFRLIERMTVYENVAFAMHVVGASPREDVYKRQSVIWSTPSRAEISSMVSSYSERSFIEISYESGRKLSSPDSPSSTVPSSSSSSIILSSASSFET